MPASHVGESCFHHPRCDNDTRLSELGASTFLNELEDGVAPPGLTASEQLASASKASGKAGNAPPKPWGNMMSPADGDPAKAADVEDKDVKKADIKAQIKALRQLLEEADRPAKISEDEEDQDDAWEEEEEDEEEEEEEEEEEAGEEEEE